MANTDKNILITPSTGTANEPTIVFTGGNNNPVTMRVLDEGALSFEASSGQLFSVTDSLTGTIFSVNDVSGIPSIEVEDDGTVRIAEFSGNVGIGINAPTEKLHVGGHILAEGDVTAYSDVAFKEDIAPIADALEKVKAVTGITFTRKSDGTRSTGVIAQEVEAVLPEAVKTDVNGFKSVAYGNLVGVLFEAIQELSAQVEDLKGRIN